MAGLMSLELVGSNTVIVAQQFNPSVMSQLWLVRNGLLNDDDFLPGCVFTDMLVQVRSREFQLVVVPPQCQFSPSVEVEREQEVIVAKVGSIVRTLPHTPYRGIGLNFVWHLVPDDGDVRSTSRALFFREDGPFHQDFTDENSRFGAYMSKDALGVRMKIDAKPIIVNQHQKDERELIQFACNFHTDIAPDDDGVAKIEQVLGRWNEAREESSRIVHAAVSEEITS